MYEYKNALVKSSKNDNRWIEKDVSGTVLRELFHDYRKVYLVLTNSMLTKPVSLDMDKVRGSLGNSLMTVKEWLVDNGNKALPTNEKLPALTNAFVRYYDMIQYGYKAKPVKISTAPDATLPLSEKTSLFITKPGVDLTNFDKRMMVCVNGYFHYIDSEKDGVWVWLAMQSQMISGLNLIGMLDFKEIGELRYEKITEDMLFHVGEGNPFSSQVGIKCKKPIEGTTPILVIGGFMHVLNDDVFYQYNDNSLVVNTNRLHLHERFQDSREYLNYETLPYTRSNTNPSMVVRDDFLSDENLKAYFTMPQSFIVFVNNQELYTAKEWIRTPPTPGLMISATKPELPLFHKTGQVINYWSRHQHGLWAITMADNQWSRRFFETNDFSRLNALMDSEQSQMPVLLSMGFFLRIGKDISIK